MQFNQWDEIIVPHLGRIKGSALLLALEAFIRTGAGDTADGFEDLNAMFRLCHSLDDEPLIISQKVRFSLVTILNNTLEEILNTQPLSDVQLFALSTNFEKCRNSNILEFATAFDFCTFLEFFNLSSTELTATTAPNATQSSSLPSDVENAAYRSMKAAGFLATDHALFLEAMERELKVARLPFPQRLASCQEVSQWVNEKAHHSLFDCGFSAMTCSVTEAAQFDEAMMEARLAIAHAVLALERYRLAHANRLPDDLSLLVPSMLDSVPLDPFDGKPIRFRKLTKGYVVYSIGPDRKDDGGVPRDEVRTDAGYSVADTNFSLGLHYS